MANTKTKTAKTAVKPATEKAVTEQPVVAASAEVPAKREQLRLDDSVLIRVKSNTFGKLVYINKRTGERTVWPHFGEEQSVTMADLRAMKGSQNDFFADNMIVITGCDDDRYADITPEEIYETLLVSKYYKNFLDPDKFGTLYSMSEDVIRERVGQLSRNGRLNLIVALNKAIEDGALDSMKKIRLFEELLNCDLAEPV